MENNKVIILRYAQDSKQTRGRGIVFGDSGEVFAFVTLELPWKNNARNISCIPEGTYVLSKYQSATNGDSFAVQDVPDRSQIRIHKGNFTSQIAGCILPGSSHADINGDGQLDVVLSAVTINKLYSVLPQTTTIKIVSV